MEIARITTLVIAIVLAFSGLGLIIQYRYSELNTRLEVIETGYGAPPSVVGTAQITDKAITTAKLADGSVTTEKLKAAAVTGAKIADGSITAGDLASGAVTSVKILDGTIATDDIADSAVTSAKIADGTIATSDIADSAVTSAKLAAGAIAASDIADSAVTSAKILDGTILTADIANDNITSDLIKDDNLGNESILDNSLDNTSIAENAIDFEELRLKIKSGKDNVVDQTTIAHGLGVAPSAVVITPAFDADSPNTATVPENLLFTVESVDWENFTVGFSENGTAFADVPGENIYWVAIYQPTDWG